jgi:hypothetical protein
MNLELTGKDEGKVVLVLNEVLHYEDVWGRGGITPRILNLGTRWR